MYRRANSHTRLLMVILLGIAAGVVYLLYDRPVADQISLPTSAPATPAPEITQPPLTPTPETPREITDGARFIAPTAGINTPVVVSYLTGASWDVSDLGRYAGHLQGTSWMDQAGNIVLAGHVEQADGRAGVFANIGQLNIGDMLFLRQHGQEHRYAVTEIRSVQPDDLSVVYPTATSRLTLITCSDYDFFRDTYGVRVVVIADRVG